MPNSDTPLIEPRDIAAAIGLLTRLPVRLDPEWLARRGPASAWAWPLAGGLVGGLAGLVGWLAVLLGQPPGIAAGLALSSMVLLTGALHEDGLADTADGFWGGRDKIRRLEIMKDSRIGTYGVLALGLGLGLRWQALAWLFAHGSIFEPLLVAGLLSRAPMALMMAKMSNARGSGLAQSVGRPNRRTAMLGAAVALTLAVLLIGFVGILGALAVALVACGTGQLAIAKIGGQTGDILGATQQVCEVTTLLVLIALA